MRYSFYCLFFVLALINFSCSNAPQNSNIAATDQSTKKEAIDTADTHLANDFSVFFTSQVNAAQLAETKASSQKVKDFARQTIRLYTQLNNKLNNISANYAINLPAPATAVSKENFKRLESIKQSSFDHQYLLQMLKQHNIMIREFNAAKNIHCMPLKIFSVSNQGDIIKQAYATSALKEVTP